MMDLRSSYLASYYPSQLAEGPVAPLDVGVGGGAGRFFGVLFFLALGAATGYAFGFERGIRTGRG